MINLFAGDYCNHSERQYSNCLWYFIANNGCTEQAAQDLHPDIYLSPSKSFYAEGEAVLAMCMDGYLDGDYCKHNSLFLSCLSSYSISYQILVCTRYLIIVYHVLICILYLIIVYRLVFCHLYSTSGTNLQLCSIYSISRTNLQLCSIYSISRTRLQS